MVFMLFGWCFLKFAQSLKKSKRPKKWRFRKYMSFQWFVSICLSVSLTCSSFSFIHSFSVSVSSNSVLLFPSFGFFPSSVLFWSLHFSIAPFVSCFHLFVPSILPFFSISSLSFLLCWFLPSFLPAFVCSCNHSFVVVHMIKQTNKTAAFALISCFVNDVRIGRDACISWSCVVRDPLLLKLGNFTERF